MWVNHIPYAVVSPCSFTLHLACHTTWLTLVAYSERESTVQLLCCSGWTASWPRACMLITAGEPQGQCATCQSGALAESLTDTDTQTHRAAWHANAPLSQVKLHNKIFFHSSSFQGEGRGNTEKVDPYSRVSRLIMISGGLPLGKRRNVHLNFC